jgi:hypothetical protein
MNPLSMPKALAVCVHHRTLLGFQYPHGYAIPVLNLAATGVVFTVVHKSIIQVLCSIALVRLLEILRIRWQDVAVLFRPLPEVFLHFLQIDDPFIVGLV